MVIVLIRKHRHRDHTPTPATTAKARVVGGGGGAEKQNASASQAVQNDADLNAQFMRIAMLTQARSANIHLCACLSSSMFH
jgi:hypothetical protein